MSAPLADPVRALRDSSDDCEAVAPLCHAPTLALRHSLAVRPWVKRRASRDRDHMTFAATEDCADSVLFTLWWIVIQFPEPWTLRCDTKMTLERSIAPEFHGGTTWWEVPFTWAAS